MQEFLENFWWLIPILLLGIILNAIRDLKKVSSQSYLDKKNGINQDKKKD